jgi:hypothetical protein
VFVNLRLVREVNGRVKGIETDRQTKRDVGCRGTRNYKRMKNVLTEPEVGAKTVVISPGGVDSSQAVSLALLNYTPSAVSLLRV